MANKSIEKATTAEITPINKGNYSMETEERNALFEKYRGEGWEAEYKKYRRDWVENAKKRIVSDYPLLVDCELSSLCNLKCPMCYTITDEFKKKNNAKLMDDKLYYKIIDEIAYKVPALRLSLRGECTLHPRLVEFVKYAKCYGINDISFLTNGSNLTVDFFVELAEAGVNWITISLDGLHEIYEKIRYPLKFQDILEKIKIIKQIKDKRNWHRPVIKIQTIYPAIKGVQEEYYNTFAPFVDLVAFNPLIDYLQNDKIEDIVYNESGFCCPQPYQRLVIFSDGTATTCSNDESADIGIGNANESSIYELWHDEKERQIRDIHSSSFGFHQLHTCKLCYLPRKTEDSESFTVNGREVIVENYVGRSQTVGK